MRRYFFFRYADRFAQLEHRGMRYRRNIRLKIHEYRMGKERIKAGESWPEKKKRKHFARYDAWKSSCKAVGRRSLRDDAAASGATTHLEERGVARWWRRETLKVLETGAVSRREIRSCAHDRPCRPARLA